MAKQDYEQILKNFKLRLKDGDFRGLKELIKQVEFDKINATNILAHLFDEYHEATVIAEYRNNEKTQASLLLMQNVCAEIKNKHIKTDILYFDDILGSQSRYRREHAKVMLDFLDRCFTDYKPNTSVDIDNLNIMQSVIAHTSRHGLSEFVKGLLDAGVDPTIRHPIFGDALSLTDYSNKESCGLMLLLIEAGCPVFGETPFKVFNSVFQGVTSIHLNYYDYIKTDCARIQASKSDLAKMYQSNIESMHDALVKLKNSHDAQHHLEAVMSPRKHVKAL